MERLDRCNDYQPALGIGAAFLARGFTAISTKIDLSHKPGGLVTPDTKYKQVSDV
jgi:hypothetical protein